ncbi:MAG: 30S ribosome-binding factor RbfA [Armatimonadota bacterium]|nr:30S ribosome-binding factor RbfA [Armatimonadota bacterium]MDR7400764.1 30S ribosome-binding factor RbfA [Armatimonadota bacterium]MDR7405121.1 30S ribosome-binding factor RbfA [Armatimonadota bacterium]MDR7436642.1 30S ribosome-binding factor RbfA [Armatimonadota bacterium]MDR7472939.1 30S ribosome-binding factor RbfA [Armatimonadota bacterium]
MSHRPDKVREFIREQVSDILHHQVKDPRIGFVSVTEVEISPDLRHARVFVSVLGDEQAKAQTMAGLHSAAGFVRGELGRRLQMRFVPEITFRLDESIERGTRVVSLIRRLSGPPDGKEAHEHPGGADRDDAAGQS